MRTSTQILQALLAQSAPSFVVAKGRGNPHGDRDEGFCQEGLDDDVPAAIGTLFVGPALGLAVWIPLSVVLWLCLH